MASAMVLTEDEALELLAFLITAGSRTAGRPPTGSRRLAIASVAIEHAFMGCVWR